MKLRLEDMTLEQKLGMVFCARKFETVDDDDMAFTLEMIKKHALGCVQLPAHNKAVCEKVLAAVDYPILVFNDTEMGFPTSPLPKVPLVSLAACGKREYFEAYAKAIVSEAKSAGFNGTWGPVIDILQGVIWVYRKLGNTPEAVASFAEIIASIYKRNHYLSTGKHYPGGESKFPLDTHMAPAVSAMTAEELLDFSLKPYIHLMKKGLLPCVMTGHTTYENIDPIYPASLSKPVIDIIRNQGFDGLIFTDSFAMIGVRAKFGEEFIYGKAIEAGNDVVLPNFYTSSRECFEMLKKNYEDGMIPEERLNDAVRHVLAAMDFIATKPEDPTEFTEEDEKLLRSIAADCITAVTENGLSASIDTKGKKLFVIVTENNFDASSDNPETDVAEWYHPERIAERIKLNFPDADIVFIPEFSGQKENTAVLQMSANYSEVIPVTFCTTTSYLGTDSLTKRTEAVLDSLICAGKVPAIVHFGNPFAMQGLMRVPERMIFGYMIPESQEYAIDVLAGKIEAKGKLPFEIKF